VDVIVLVAQAKLAGMGYEADAPDGVWAQGTRSAVLNFQAAKGLQPTGALDNATRRELGIRSMEPLGSLKVRKTPPIRVEASELVRRVKQMPASVVEQFAIYRITDVDVDIGHIRQVIKDECTSKHSSAIGEFYFWRRGISSMRLPEGTSDDEKADAKSAHDVLRIEILKTFRGDGFVLCTPVVIANRPTEGRSGK
jgi:hypothetical protein